MLNSLFLDLKPPFTMKDVKQERALTPKVFSPVETRIYEFGLFRLDLGTRQLFRAGVPLHLPPKTFDILKILVENSGQVATNEQLISEVWPDEHSDESELTARVAALKKVLMGAPGNRFIEAVSGYGYRFVGRVRIVPRVNEAQKEIPSIAILPFLNETDQTRLNYICDGVTEALIEALTHISDLRVMARSTVFRHKSQDRDLLKIGHDLNVETLLVGRVRLVTNQLEFDLEMIDAGTGEQLWSAKYSRRVDDLVTFQEELVREISEQLRLKLSTSERSQIATSHTSNSEAHLLYMKGRYFWNQRSFPGVKTAISYFEKAIGLDPHYALSFAGLADCYSFLAGAELELPKHAMPKAKAAALKAISLDRQLAEPHVTLGNILSSYELDWSGAEIKFEQAIKLNPYHAPAYHYYANLLVKLGYLDRALTEINKAYPLDPLAINTNLTMGKLYYFARHYEEAVRKGYEILEAHPQFGAANGLIGLAYLELGRTKEAIKEFRVMFQSLASESQRHREEGESTSPFSDPESLALMGYGYAMDRKRSKALEMLEKVEKLTEEKYVQPHHLAILHMGLGNINQVFDLLERAFEERVPGLTYLKVWPMFDRIRTDSRYYQLIQKLGL